MKGIPLDYITAELIVYTKTHFSKKQTKKTLSENDLLGLFFTLIFKAEQKLHLREWQIIVKLQKKRLYNFCESILVYMVKGYWGLSTLTQEFLKFWKIVRRGNGAKNDILLI